MAKTSEQDLKLVEYGDGAVTYDQNMRMGDLRKLFKAAREGDMDTMMGTYSQIVMSWPYEGDPTSGLEAWDELRKDEFQALNEAIMGDLGDEGEG